MFLPLLLLSLLTPTFASSFHTYPPYPINGTSQLQYTLQAPFDGPKAASYNTTSFQWWYFDLLHPSLNQSAVVTFFIGAGATGLQPGAPWNVVELDLQLENGTMVSLYAVAGEAKVLTQGAGASGWWEGTGYSWWESRDLGIVVVEVDDPVNDVKGSLRFSSRAPAHSFCGPAVAGADTTVVPHLAWLNAIPDAEAAIDLSVNGERIKYEGVGYHDGNWGDQTLSPTSMWYWGHARVGDLSVVWSDVLDLVTLAERTTGYVAQNGTILSSSCSGLTVRPTGQNSTFPPIPGAEPSGFHVVYDMGEKGVLEVNVTNGEAVVDEPPSYMRWVGNAVGGIRGHEVKEGVALYEWMGA